ncbi:uncharacterized protein FOMMEDRAFT_161252 [Fomitiporia mediterranea MF3/22]|uniref:uncharacterized protein n=1 Tax=Fomitiporia mediterranea (strain MF3/22) TaxID=694068 RepID=UPI00044088D7|nr:uncharacterized protein FOMMEDRAFT_161252 [Fomitiporia mediterranea MF3/22]EJC99037.1 hypothetical protein FOMMEDRAFT_161252 [Fomitiporia mediterranea MF3/22]
MSLDLNYFIHYSGYGLGTVNVERTHRIMHVRGSIYTKEDTLERNRISMRDLIPYAPLDFKIEESDEQMFEYVEGNYSNWRRLGGGATVQGIITEGEMDMDTVHLVFVVQESVVPAKRSRPSAESAFKTLKRSKFATMAPSTFATPSVYKKNQETDQRILDDRPCPDTDVPPIALLYAGFGRFIDIYQGDKEAPTLSREDAACFETAVDEFADEMTCFYDHENLRRDAAIPILNRILPTFAGPTLGWRHSGRARNNVIC